jgi:hypothetical protein
MFALFITRYYEGDQINKNELDETHNTHGDMKNGQNMLVGNHDMIRMYCVALV